MSSETWWYGCNTQSDATRRIENSENSATHVKLATADQTFTAKDLGRGVLNTCSTGSISGTRTGTGTGTGTGIYRDLYSLPELYRYNTGRIQRMLFSYPNTHPT